MSGPNFKPSDPVDFLVIGAGAAKRLSAVRWGMDGNIVFAWVLTLPACILLGWALHSGVRLLGG